MGGDGVEADEDSEPAHGDLVTERRIDPDADSGDRQSEVRSDASNRHRQALGRNEQIPESVGLSEVDVEARIVAAVGKGNEQHGHCHRAVRDQRVHRAHRAKPGLEALHRLSVARRAQARILLGDEDAVIPTEDGDLGRAVGKAGGSGPLRGHHRTACARTVLPRPLLELQQLMGHLSLFQRVRMTFASSVSGRLNRKMVWVRERSASARPHVNHRNLLAGAGSRRVI